MSDLNALMHEAALCLDNGQLEQALALYSQICTSGEAPAEAWMTLGAIQAELGNLEPATQHLRKALQLQPDYSAAHFTLGHLLRAQGDQQQALQCFRQAAHFDPQDAEAHFTLGQMLVALEQRAAALPCFQQAVRCDNDHAPAWLMLAWSLQQAGNTSEALAAYRRAAELDPTNPSTLFELANLQKLAGDLDDALASYQRALQLKPDYPEAYNNMGTALQAQGDFQAAIQAYQSALRYKPDFPQAQYNCGRSLEACRNLDAAITCYRQALRIQPDYLDAQHSLGSALTIKGDLKEAAVVIRQVLGIPNDAHNIVFGPSITSAIDEPNTAGTTKAPAYDILLATSLAPKNFENQRLAVASWLKLGFEVVSINSAEEIAVLQPEFPDITFVVAGRNARERFGKPYIYFDDVLEYFASTPSQICGIINSDIHLRHDGLRSFLLKETPGSFLFGCRTDVSSLDDHNGKIYKYGFDYFFMDRKFLGIYPKDTFCIGLPWWDYWAPLIPRLRKIPLKQLTTPVALHITHPLNWNDDNYIEFAHIIGKYMGVTKPPHAVKRLGTYQNYAWILIDEYAKKIAIPE